MTARRQSEDRQPTKMTKKDNTPKIPAAQRVLDHILLEMDAGRLQPGDRVNASRLGESLGLSISPVREALGKLEGRGVVTLHPDRGAVIRQISIVDVQQLFSIMASLVSIGVEGAARAIAAGADTAELCRLYDDIAISPSPVRPIDFLIRLDLWHYEANRLGGNPHVTEMLDRAGLEFWLRFLPNYIPVLENIGTYRLNYRRIHDAVMAGDGAGAMVAVWHHSKWSQQTIAASAPTQRRRRPRIASTAHP